MLILSIDIYFPFIAFIIPVCVHTQLCSTLYDSMSVPHQAPLPMEFSKQELEWVAISSSKESS